VKGVIINILEQFINENYGDETLEEMYDKVELSDGAPPFVGPLSYPDEDFLNMVRYVSKKNGMPDSELLHAVGKYALSVLAEKYPPFFENIYSAQDFLFTVNDIHEMEVKKLYDDARPPEIILEHSDAGRALLHYRSSRQLCSLLEGLIDGAAEKYGENIEYKHVRCMKDGAEECTLELIFSREEQKNG